MAYYKSSYSRGAYGGSGYGYSRGTYGGGTYGSGYGRRKSYGKSGFRRKKRVWPKGKKNSNAWGRIIETDHGKAFIGGAWLYDFRRKALFKVDITPKYSRKDGDGWERVDPNYTTEDGRIRYKVKCTLENVDTFTKAYGTSTFNPDSGKIYFENLDLMINVNKRTACFHPFSGQYKPRGWGRK